VTPDPAVVRFSQLWFLGSVYNYRAWVDVPRLRVLPVEAEPVTAGGVLVDAESPMGCAGYPEL
jgi:hypothetical protein